MTATKNAIAQWLCLAAFATVCSAEEAGNDFEVEALARAERAFLVAVAELGEAIEVCSQTADKSGVPILDVEKLSQLEAERGDIIIGLAHLSTESMFRCERDARLAMAYRAGALAHLREQFGKSAEQIESIERSYIYPSAEDYKYEIGYEKLPQDLKLYLTEVAGSEPFDVIKAVELNNLGSD